MIEIKTCPNCESKEIRKVRRNWTGQYKGKTYIVPDLDYYECPDCGEKVYDREAMRRIEEKSPAYDRSHVNKKSA